MSKSSKKGAKSCSKILSRSKTKTKLLSIIKSNEKRSPKKCMPCFKSRRTISWLRQLSKNEESFRNSTRLISTSVSARWVSPLGLVQIGFLWLKWLTRTWARRTFSSQLKWSKAYSSPPSSLQSSAGTTSRASMRTQTLSEIWVPAHQCKSDQKVESKSDPRGVSDCESYGLVLEWSKLTVTIDLPILSSVILESYC